MKTTAMRPGHARTSLWLVAAGAAFALTLTGCSTAGSSASGGSGSAPGEQTDGMKEAQSRVEAASAVPEFLLGDAPTVDAAALAGKKVTVIPLSSENAYAMEINDNMKRIADEYGLEFSSFTNQGQPNQWAQGIDQAIDAQTDAIVLLAGADPRLVVPQLTRAKEAGIPIVVAHLYQNDTQPPEAVRDLISGYTTAPFNEAAALLADYTIAKGGSSTKVVYITSDDVGPAPDQEKAFMAEMSELCPDCTADRINVPAAEWATKLTSETQSYLVSNPDTEWIVPIYDGMTPGVVAAINQTGKSGQVRVATYNGTPSILKLVQEDGPVAADIGESVDWLAYSAMDSTFRVLTTGEGLQNGSDKMPLRIFDESNVDEAGTPPTSDKGYGDAYIAGYEKLWGGK
jgi:ribose transport system substrate-binding protein